MISQSQTTFICCHCGCRYRKNVRLKGHQRYCGSKACQSARKKQWERDRLKRDEAYRLKRQSSKKAWYNKYPGNRYQSSYRASHPDYVSGNREKQRLRASCNREKQGLRGSKNTGTLPDEKIVKADALLSESLVSKGFYVLVPYKKTCPEKIVKTDALIIELLSNQGLQAILSARSP